MLYERNLANILVFSFLTWLCASEQKQVEDNESLGSDGQWQAWKLANNKTYGNENEDSRRKSIWQRNLKKIRDHNTGNHSFTLAMNQLGDLTEFEYRELLLKNKFRQGTRRNGSTFLAPANVEMPPSVDWREHGYVTRVKNQGACGSCWAFSATGSLEGQNFKKTKKLVALSEQNLVDCSYWYGNHGCNGGLMNKAFRYVEDYGIDTEESYPYVAKENYFCFHSQGEIGARCSGYVNIEEGSEVELQSAVAAVGPISAAIDADHSSYQLYHSGVYDEPDCSSSDLDHGVLVVGYGTRDGRDYWLVKNSWGESWGLNGYMMMSRNKDNQCGIASLASYPLV